MKRNGQDRLRALNQYLKSTIFLMSVVFLVVRCERSQTSGGGDSELPAPPVVPIVNQAPVCLNPAALAMDEDQVAPLAGSFNCSDSDGPLGLTYNQVSGPSHAQAFSISGNSFSYKPQANYYGSDSFTVRANDGEDNSNIITINISVNSINDLPTCSNLSPPAINEDSGAFSGTLNCTDIDGPSTLVLSQVTGPAHALSFSIAGNSFSYQPASNYSETDSFTFRAYDGLSYSSPATVSITINSLNDAPVCLVSVSPYQVTTYGSPVVMQTTCSDVDIGDVLTYSISAAYPIDSSLGSVSFSGSQLTYTPKAGASGTDSFHVVATDLGGLSNYSLGEITVAVNVPPTCPALNSPLIPQGGTWNFSTGCTDPNGQTLSYTVSGFPQYGNVSAPGANGSGSYVQTPALLNDPLLPSTRVQYVINDTFQLKVMDSMGLFIQDLASVKVRRGCDVDGDGKITSWGTGPSTVYWEKDLWQSVYQGNIANKSTITIDLDCNDDGQFSFGECPNDVDHDGRVTSSDSRLFADCFSGSTNCKQGQSFTINANCDDGRDNQGLEVVGYEDLNFISDDILNGRF